jgi:hypothetical protein
MFGRAFLPLAVLLSALAPVWADDLILPDQTKTPGEIDENVHGTEICAENWARGT